MSRDPAADKAPVSNMPKNSHTITLVGAGLTGPLLAISLAQRGFPVQIFERRPDMRFTRASAGRSINLAVSTRGIHALREAGLWDQMSRIIIPDERPHDAFARRANSPSSPTARTIPRSSIPFRART